VHRLVRFMNGDKQCFGFIPDIYKLLDKYQLHPYFLKGCTVCFKVRMESDPQTTCVAVQYTDNGTGVEITGTNGCRPMLSVQTEYPTYGVSAGIHPLFH